MNLVIVESPTKAKTISRFLGENFIVASSYGHIRDLPKSKLGVDVEHNFAPQYIVPVKARKNLTQLKKDAAKAEKVILATDEDREGEAIAWHLAEALDLAKTKKPAERIVFHEITKAAIEEALLHPRNLDLHLVDAQQARRILDRLVGYKLSPFLWKKVRRGLSAGRVQSVAVRLVVERENEVRAFKPQEYWTIDAVLEAKTDNTPILAALVKIKNETLDKFAIPSGTEAEKIVSDLRGANWIVERIEKRALTRKVPPPFTTSTLQQEAWRRLHFSAKKTMVLAQRLYEGTDVGEGGPAGLITYMRTDSLNLSVDSTKSAYSVLKKLFGEKYALPAPRVFKTKTKGAQEAHEAIRPSDPARTPDSLKQYLERDQYRLYDLVWRRFFASQMPAALFDQTAVTIAANDYSFRANGQIMQFDGFLKIYPQKFEEHTLPPLSEKDALALKELKPNQHFTEPPPRFTEASLIKTLEENGIGRPSTYAPTMATIQDRGYVEKDEQKRLRPTEIGEVVNKILVEHFPAVVDVQFTAKMEEEFDEIAEGKMEWQPVIKEFYEPFAKIIEAKYAEVEKQTPVETTDEVCEKCGRPMVVKYGRFGKFLACSGFPECKNAKPLPKAPPKSTGVMCPECNQGELVERWTRKKRLFFGCIRYPDCKFATWTDPRKQAPEKKKDIPEEKSEKS